MRLVRMILGLLSRGEDDAFRDRPSRVRARTSAGRCGIHPLPGPAGRRPVAQSPALVVALTAEYPSPQSLRRLEHEYSFAAVVDPAWAAKPLALTRHEGRPILVLKDPGGDP